MARHLFRLCGNKHQVDPGFWKGLDVIPNTKRDWTSTVCYDLASDCSVLKNSSTGSSGKWRKVRCYSSPLLPERCNFSICDRWKGRLEFFQAHLYSPFTFTQKQPEIQGTFPPRQLSVSQYVTHRSYRAIPQHLNIVIWVPHILFIQYEIIQIIGNKTIQLQDS